MSGAGFFQGDGLNIPEVSTQYERIQRALVDAETAAKESFDQAQLAANAAQEATTAAQSAESAVAEALGSLTTSEVPEGNNLYFTDERAANAAPVQSVAGHTGAVSLTTSDVAEGSNLYHTAERAAAAAPVQSVAGKSGAVSLDKSDVGLSNVDNTSDANKPVSTATQNALNQKANTSEVVPKTGGSFTGNVGIGTSTPTFPLEAMGPSGVVFRAGSNNAPVAQRAGVLVQTVGGAAQADRQAAIILDPNGADGVGGDYGLVRQWGLGDLEIQKAGAGAIRLNSSGTVFTLPSGGDAMRIDKDGHVGIGTSSVAPLGFSLPTLQIKGPTTSRAGGARFTSSDASLELAVYAADGSGYVSMTGSHPLTLQTSNVERARIDPSGNLLVGTTTGIAHSIRKAVAAGGLILEVGSPTTSLSTAGFYGVTEWAVNEAAAAFKLGRNATTGSSIRAGGTINASGADYAEYMVKRDDCGIIEKGDVCGVDAYGRLTDRYTIAHSFVIKSTDPAIVGNDTWGREDVVGPRPAEPQAVTPERLEDEDPEDYALRVSLERQRYEASLAQYLADLEVWMVALEDARQQVDRIAFSGQVPVNISGPFQVGDYVIAQEGPEGGIEAVAIRDPSLEQYRNAVGKVWKVLPDGRPWVAVKIG